MLKNYEKIKYLNIIKDNSIYKEISNLQNKLEIEANNISIINKFSNENMYFLNGLKDELLIKENLSQKNFEGRIIITQKGLNFMKDYECCGNRIEFFAQDYPFFASLIIGFIGGLGATILNVFFK